MVLMLYYGSKVSRKKWYACLAGSFFALGCIAYPFFIIAAFPLGILLFLLPPEGGIKRAGRLFLWILAGVLFVFLPILLYVSCTSGFFHIFENIPYLLGDAEHPSKNVWLKSLDFLGAFYHQLFLGPLQLIWLVCSFLSPLLKEKKIFFFLLTHRFVPFFCFAAEIYFLFQPYSNPSKINILQSCAGLWPLILFVQKPNRQNAILLFILYVPSLVLSWAIYLASNNGMNGASYPLLFGIMAMLLLLDKNREDVFIQRFKKGEKGFWNFLAISFILLNLCFRVGTVYRDTSLFTLTARLENGPAKGLYTTGSSAAAYEGILKDIQFFQQEGRILFHKLLPFGYLYARQLPASPSLWRISLPSERMEKYFLQNPQNRPTILYSVKAPYGIGNSQELSYQQAEKLFGCAVQVLETPYAMVYVAER